MSTTRTPAPRHTSNGYAVGRVRPLVALAWLAPSLALIFGVVLFPAVMLFQASRGEYSITGLRKGGASWAKAENAKLKVAEVGEAVKSADIVMMLLPDEQIGAVYKNDVEPNIKQGASLAFAHGFNVHYGQVVPRADLDVWMVAPKAPGHTVRSTYTQGGGVPHLGNDRIVSLRLQVGGSPLAVTVEQPAHLGREEHRRSAGTCLPDRFHQRLPVPLRIDPGLRLEQRDPAHAARRVSSRPSRSSANRSSQPPTWRPSMKICGTVIRPERSIISSRLGPPPSRL